ncbi:MAG: SemiSWEET family transporter, partial [Spirochaetota bacterium]
MIAGALTTAAFIPQALRIIKTKNTAGLSLSMYIIMCSGLSLWLTYGLLT